MPASRRDLAKAIRALSMDAVQKANSGDPGMPMGTASAERTLIARFNRKPHDIVDHYTNVFAGDGCLMEGISHQTSSVAAALSLGRLIDFYGDNAISIGAEVKDWFSDDTSACFEAFGCSGNASRIRSISLEHMAHRYQVGELERRLH